MLKLLCWSIVIVLICIVGFILKDLRFYVGLLQYGGQSREGTLAVGDTAPKIGVWDLDGEASHDLGGHFGTVPVVLVFGSFT